MLCNTRRVALTLKEKVITLVSREQSVQKKIRAMLVKVPILVAISLGLLLFVAKIRFIFKLGRAKTDFNVFNYSLALRLIISGTENFNYFSVNYL